MKVVDLLNNTKQMDTHNCLLCNTNKADKIESHMIPSFLVSKYYRYSEKSKRGSEIMFLLEPYKKKLYMGRDIPDTKLEEFGNYHELQNDIEHSDPFTASNTLCSNCEKDLSYYLETPYSQKKSSPDVAYMFWASVVWRLSASGMFGYKLPLTIENELRNALCQYLNKKKKGEEISDLFSKIPFKYRLIMRDEPKMNNAGFYIEYFNNILTITIGSILLCVTFHNDEIPLSYNYYGVEEAIRKAPVNSGEQQEQKFELVSSMFDSHLLKIASKIMFNKMLEEKEIADWCWCYAKGEKQMPTKVFYELQNRLRDKNSKIGDILSSKRYVDIFNELLIKYKG